MLKILIIEDDPAGTRLITTLLRLEGYQACALANWANPVSDIEQLRPALVIMDVHLPGQNGFELLSQIRSHPDPTVAHVPVLMTSAEDYGRRSRAAGAAGFLAKPFGLQALLDAIRAVAPAGAARG